MKKITQYLNKNITTNFLIISLFSLMVEIIFKLSNNFKLMDWSFIRILLSVSILSAFVSYIEYFLKPKYYKKINITLIVVMAIYALLQTGFNNYIGVYISLGASSQLGAVTDYVKEFILSFKCYYYFNLLPIVAIILFYKKKNINLEQVFIKLTEKKVTLSACLFVGLISLYMSTLYLNLMQNPLQTIQNKDLFLNANVPSVSIKQLGVTIFGIVDVKNYFIPPKEIIKLEQMDIHQKETERKFDDTKWKELIEKEENDTLKTLNEYFINNKITDINDYTGYFKNKNLIVIMLESVNDIFINKEDYPNFYKMYTEGWSFKNNYSPRNSCSTGNNEMSGMIGIYSIYNTCTTNDFKGNTYFNSIFNLFNKENYYTFSAHNYTEHYYERRTIHKNMGSQKYYGVEDLNIDYSDEYKDWSSDEDFMNEFLNILDNNKDGKFMTWLTTVSSHQPYGYSSKEGDKYLDLFEDEDISMELKRYKSKLKILDNALGILLDGLEKRKILDDTVIVMFGDHYPYGLPTDMINSVLDYDVSKEYEAERTPFVIYNSKEKGKVIYDYTTYVNIVPTIANLFGLDYDPRLYTGEDLFNDDYESIAIFADGSWKNDKAYYNSAEGTIKYYRSDEYSVEELQKINSSITNKINMSNLAIKNNYYNYLENALKDKKEEETK